MAGGALWCRREWHWCRKIQALDKEAVERLGKWIAVGGMGSEEGRSHLNNLALHGMDWDVLQVALWCWDGFERGWTPHGGNGNVLMGEDEDVEAADEGVGCREGAVVGRYQRREGEV